jgi:thiopeptide-type bacteriocin biosynthesis protein
MSTDQLTVPNAAGGIEKAVLAVLAGTPLPTAAARAGLRPALLADTVATYQAAGRAALTTQAAAWYQLCVEFPDPTSAEASAATHLAPVLRAAQATGIATAWWFVRKTPDWRLRISPATGTSTADLRAALGPALDGLTAAGVLHGWSEGIYEPEVCALGGEAAIETAHQLFAADSHHILERTRVEAAGKPPSGLGRRELSVLLIATLLRAAALDWYERGDVFDRVSQLRPPPATPPDTTQIHGLAAALRRLLTADTDPAGGLFGAAGPLATASGWAGAFHDAGLALGSAARAGTLRRGLRDVFAHHVLFHWNRLGLTTATQGVLAAAARETILSAPALPDTLTPQVGR